MRSTTGPFITPFVPLVLSSLALTALAQLPLLPSIPIPSIPSIPGIPSIPFVQQPSTAPGSAPASFNLCDLTAVANCASVVPSVERCVSGVRPNYLSVADAAVGAQGFASCMCGSAFAYTAPLFPQLSQCTGCIVNAVPASSFFTSIASILTAGGPNLGAQSLITNAVSNLQALPTACNSIDAAGGYIRVLERTQMQFMVNDKVVKAESLVAPNTTTTVPGNFVASSAQKSKGSLIASWGISVFSMMLAYGF
ncbi:hypothetical protein HDU67_003558 [Dinochytrium kinnereticum]|nr:hypothetical protein HDU67_003558 [Dinochytrium kinnereticum]